MNARVHRAAGGTAAESPAESPDSPPNANHGTACRASVRNRCPFQGQGWWRHWNTANIIAASLGGYFPPVDDVGTANVKLHAVSISADLSRPGEAHSHAEQVDPAMDDAPSEIAQLDDFQVIAERRDVAQALAALTDRTASSARK